jgi:CheY-like chemotaxis protein
MDARVLLVDDDEADILFLQDAFKRTNFPYPVVVARDGERALEILESSAALPRLVILDLKTPKMGGLDLLKRLRASERLRAARVVATRRPSGRCSSLQSRPTPPGISTSRARSRPRP